MSRARSKPYLPPHEPKDRTFAQFQQWLDQITPKDIAKRTCLLFGAAHLSFDLHENDITSDQGTLPGIAALVLISKILTEPIFPLCSKDASTVEACVDVARHFQKEAEGIIPDCYPIDISPNRTPTERDIIELGWMSNVCSSGQYQGDVMYLIANTLILTGLSGFGSLLKDPQWTEKLFINQQNIPAYHYYIILFGIWSVAGTEVFINKQKFIQDGPHKKELQAAAVRIIEDLSFKVNEPLDSPVLSFSGPISGKAKAESIFSRKPLIQVSEHHYLISARPFLKIQLTAVFLTKCLALARAEEGGKRGITEYSKYIGYRFEKFFHELCEYWEPEGGNYEEYEYLSGKNNKSPDEIVFEKHCGNDVAILFQVKSKMLTEAAHFGVSVQAFKKEMASAFCDSISQSIKYLFAVHRAVEERSLNPESMDISLRVIGAERCCLIGIVPVLPAVFTIRHVREELLAHVKSDVGEDCWNWFADKYKNKKWLWHIMEVSEFEKFLELPNFRRKFYKITRKYFEESQLETCAMDISGSAPDNFRSYLIKRFSSQMNRIPILEVVAKEFFDDAKKYFKFG